MNLSTKPNRVTTHQASAHAPAEGGDISNQTKAFNRLISRLVCLHKDGTIDDEGFSQLVRMASTSFIESEITHTVDCSLEAAFAPDRLLRSWR